MKKRYFRILFVAFICLQLLLCFYILRTGESEDLDIAAVNKLTKECETNWGGLKQKKFSDFPETGLTFSVLEKEGTLLYTTGGSISQTVQEAVVHRDTIIDITVAGETAGKLLINNDMAGKVEEQTQKVVWLVAGSAALTIIVFILYLVYLQKQLLAPFDKLQRFASRVAAGDFDIPLEMDRKNVFGAFTESFDLMRGELKQAREQERAAEQSKKELVAQLSHDIKTPTATIKAVSELLEVRAVSQKEKEQLRIIGSKADQIDGLISNLFHATLEELEELHVELNDYNSSVLREIVGTADYLNQAVIGNVPECMLQLDIQRITQVIDNIMVNSYKYAGTSIDIDCFLDNQFLQMTIRDYGPGVDDDELSLITGKFYRGNNARGKSGTGLGLYISSYLMKKMGGELLFHNKEPGFELTLILCLSGTSFETA